MGCIRNRSRIWANWLLLVVGIVYLVSADRAEARFAIGFSPTLGELYTDNIFYTKQQRTRFRHYNNPDAVDSICARGSNRTYLKPQYQPEWVDLCAPQ